MATVLAEGGLRVSFRVPVKYEESEHGWLASNDEIQVAAAGDTMPQARDNFKAAVMAMIGAFGSEMLEPYRHVELVDID